MIKMEMKKRYRSLQQRVRMGDVQKRDIVRKLGELAFGRVNDCVRLALEDSPEVEKLDLGTYMLYIAECNDAVLLGSGQALTLDDYMNKGNVAPPTATVIRALEEVTSWKCTICGYIAYKEELPDDYKCPICKAGKDKFVKQ